MFPSSGYFRGVNCPFFASGLCDRAYCHFRHSKPPEEKPKETLPSYSTKTGPSYSFNSSQISGYSASPYLQKNASGSNENYSTKETSQQSNSLDSYTTSPRDESLVSIPSFTGSSSVLPESAPEPQIDRHSLPKISGLAKRKPHTPPSYKPTPKNQINKPHESKPSGNDIPSYHPTPKHSLTNSESKSGSKSVIQYDPEKNFAVSQKEYSSSDEENDTKQSCSLQDSSEHAEFSEDEEVSEEKDPNAKGEQESENASESISTPIPSYAEFLTPSSYFTSKLSSLSSSAKPDGDKSQNSRLPADSASSSKGLETDSRRKNSPSQSAASSRKIGSKSQHHSSSSKSAQKSKVSSSSHKNSSSSSSSKLSSASKTKSASQKHLSSSQSSKGSKVQSAPSKDSSSSSKTKSSSESKVKSSSPRELSPSSNSKKKESHSSSASTSSSSSKSKSVKSPSDHLSSHHGSKSSAQESIRKSDHNSVKSVSKHSHSQSKTSDPNLKSTENESNSGDNLIKTSSKYSSSSSSKHSGAKKSISEKGNSHEKHAMKSSHSKSSPSSKELNQSSSEKLKKEESGDKKISRSLSSNIEMKKSQNHINNKVKEERRHSFDNKKDVKLKSHSFSEKDKNRESNRTEKDRRRSVERQIKSEERPRKSKSVLKRRISDITSDLFGENSDGSDSDVQIIEPPPEPPPEVLELTDSDEDYSSSALLKDEDFDFSDTDTFDECLRIFQETDMKLKLAQKRSAQPEHNKVTKNEPEASVTDNTKVLVAGKKRMAHPSAQQVIRPFKASLQTKTRLSPAEVMHNRIIEMQKRALLRAAKREGREEELPGNFKNKSHGSSSAAGSSHSSSPGATKLSSDVGFSGSTILSQKKREAHLPSTPTKMMSSANSKSSVWSPNSFYSKKKPQADGKQEQRPKTTVTVASTASKTEKRKAHVPVNLNLKRPLIPAGNSSKVPVNVRQRYLNLIIDDFLKFCQEEIAFRKGEEEEQEVYNRANNKNIYLRLVVNAIKRIRTEAAMSQPSSSKKAKLNLSELASHGSSTVTQSHEATLGGSRAAKTSFTLNRSAGSRINTPINFKGLELYNRLKKHILTEEQLRDNGYPRTSEDGSSKAQFYTSHVQDTLMKDNERICRRCGKRYYVTEDGTPVTEQECIYHYSNIYKKKVAGSLDSRYGCCNEKTGVKGCQVSSTHVNERNKYDNLTGYMKTLPAPESDPKNSKVLSLDCEMVYTKAGLELARVTVIGDESQVVYETLVKPDTEVIDYNTRFSGIKATHMKGVVTTLRGVQAVILSMVSDKTILMGHSLESDLTALKMIHNTVVDTAIVFPHRLGLPFKRALRNLALDYLQKIIQADDSGHDSKEDAVSCMQLMIYKIKEEAKSEVRRI